MSSYNAKKISLIKTVKLIDTDKGKYILKKFTDKDSLRDTFNYLESKGFNNYLDYIDEYKDYLVFPYIETLNNDIDESSKSLIEVVALLHKKTEYYKTVSNEKIKEFYEKQINALNDLEKYYDDLVLKSESEMYPSPSIYYFLRNSSIVFKSIQESKIYLDKWYSVMKEKKSKRVCFIHGNLGLDHFLYSNNKYLISWNNSRNDSCIYDILSFYKKHYEVVPFIELLNLYDSIYPLLEEELYLLMSLILFPKKIELVKPEINNVSNIYNIINYLIISNNITSNYHSSDTNSKS